jgi:hypothetical protein
VWAPALVGWVGGAGWNITLRDHGNRPASGWYPLTPHDRFVPGYHASENHLRWMNDGVRADPHRPRDWRPQGLTVVAQERFSQPGRVDVAHAPHASAPPALAGRAPAAGLAAPPPPPPSSHRPQRDQRFARAQERDRGQEHGLDTGRISRDGFIRQETPVFNPPISGQPAQPLGVISPTPHQPPQALGVTSPTPHQPPQGQGVISPTPHQMTQPPVSTDPAAQPPAGWQRGERWERNERNEHYQEQRREQFQEQRGERQPMQAPAAQPAPQGGFGARTEHAHRGEWERPQAAPTPAQVAPRPMPAPAMAAAAPVAPAAPPARPAGPAPQRGGEQHGHGDQKGQHQQDR